MEAKLKKPTTKQIEAERKIAPLMPIGWCALEAEKKVLERQIRSVDGDGYKRKPAANADEICSAALERIEQCNIEQHQMMG